MVSKAAAEAQCQHEEKKLLRQQFLAARRTLTQEERLVASHEMIERLRALPEFRQARSIFLYASLPDEVQLYELMDSCLAEGRQVVLPLIKRKGFMVPVLLPGREALVTGEYGIATVRAEARRELAPERLDLIIVPGAAFAPNGARLGLGAGFYDRFMAEQAPQALRVALAFDCQLADSLPMEEHDQYVQFILTESRQIICGKVN